MLKERKELENSLSEGKDKTKSLGEEVKKYTKENENLKGELQTQKDVNTELKQTIEGLKKDIYKPKKEVNYLHEENSELIDNVEMPNPENESKNVQEEDEKVEEGLEE